jgi:hypothetical protein
MSFIFRPLVIVYTRVGPKKLALLTKGGLQRIDVIRFLVPLKPEPALRAHWPNIAADG